MFVFLETPEGIVVPNTDHIESVVPAAQDWVIHMASGNLYYISHDNARTIFGVLSQKGEIRGNYRLAMKEE